MRPFRLSKEDIMAHIRFLSMFFLALPLAACAGNELAERKEPQAQRKNEVPRRAVPALVERPATVTPPAPAVPMPSVPQTSVPSGPAPVTGCDAGGCWSGGNRYNGGTGGTYIDKGGRPCQSNGAFMQCF